MTKFEEQQSALLTELQFTPIQIRCYLVLLQEGPMSVTQLASRLAVNRTNMYQILKQTLAEEIIWEERISHGKLLHAASYDQFQFILEEKKKKLEIYEKQLDEAIPIFNTFFHSKTKEQPLLKSFMDKQGLRTLIDTILDEKTDEILLFTNQETEKKYFSRSLHTQFIKRRIAKKIPIKVLAVRNKEAELLLKSDRESLRQTKLLPTSFSFFSEIYLFQNKIILIDVEEHIIGILLDSEELYNIHKQLFNFLWQSL
jgi:sugar-specific transcriptional regulator TrmB